MYHHITGRITVDHVEPLKMEVVTRYVVIDNTTPDNIASVAAIQFLAHPYLHCGSLVFHHRVHPPMIV